MIQEAERNPQQDHTPLGAAQFRDSDIEMFLGYCVRGPTSSSHQSVTMNRNGINVFEKKGFLGRFHSKKKFQ